MIIITTYLNISSTGTQCSTSFLHLGIHIPLFKYRNFSLICFFLQHPSFWNYIVRHTHNIRNIFVKKRKKQTWKDCVILLCSQQQMFMKFESILTLQHKGRSFISIVYITKNHCFKHRKNTLISSPYIRKYYNLLMQEKKTRGKKDNIKLRHVKMKLYDWGLRWIPS